MEGKLKTQDNKGSKDKKTPEQHRGSEIVFETGEPIGMHAGIQQSMTGASEDYMPTNEPIMLPIANMVPAMMPEPEHISQIDLSLDQSFSWEMIGLGLEEPMPTQEAVDELYNLHPPIAGYANMSKEHTSFSIKYIPLYQ